MGALRRAGDRTRLIFPIWQPSASVRVLWSRYTPTSSAVMLVEEWREFSGEQALVIASHRAQLYGDDVLEYTVTDLDPLRGVQFASYELVRQDDTLPISEPFNALSSWKKTLKLGQPRKPPDGLREADLDSD